MESKSEIKLKNRLKDLEAARKRADEYIVRRQLTEETPPGNDPFELGLVMADVQRAYAYYQLADAEAYPGTYPDAEIKRLKQEVEELTKRVRAFQARQWPSQVRD